MFRGNGDAVLADFGIAKQLATDLALTGKGRLVGSPFYMSPEQIRGETLDDRADLYSFGIVLWEMLTRKRPFTGDSLDKIWAGHIDAPIPRLPANLERYQALIDGLLAKRPKDRFAGAAEALAAIQAG